MDAAKKKLILPERLYPFEDLIDQDAQGLVELISPQALAVPTSQVPLVSIIIPIYNQALYTFNCLRAIASNTDGIDYEVIVIDDCSTDQTATMLSQIRGIRVERHHHNQGFIASCNRGASLAQGQYLCFLNNDTQVLPGWLGRLVQTFRAYPQAGAVGAKLLYGDRTLQEAGGIVWQDGRATNFGKYGDHHQPAYNYVRSVDYCSAACLLVRQNLFNQVGGFDPHFAPAYYEDTDLCFQLRARGYQVLYQPRAVVIHYEGISHGV
ncbi:MAG: glycosyltransferase family 2 protein, partial [Pseudanabaenaceae cyanobacterium bins.68]|nr:glycosyltransferase family 2 protein [Pseudanabaenaceae cyanobacterium bins.68]